MTYQKIPSLGTLSSAQAAAREKLSQEVVLATSKVAERIDYLLSNEVTLLSAMTRGLIFAGTVHQARESLKRAKEDLFQKFRPIALAAIEDPNRNLSEIKSSIEGYLYSLEQQLKIVLQINENQNFTGAISKAFDDAQTMFEEKLDPTKSWIPWALGAGAVITLAVLLRR
jgi:hypothetical protein